MFNIRNVLWTATFSILSIALIPVSIASQLSPQDITILQPTRLVTDAEHKAFLISTLDSSQNNDTLLISSYDISPKIFHNDNIAGRIVNAAARGARIYIYFEHATGQFSPAEDRALEDLRRSCVKFEVNCNHSKCVVKNKDLVAIGSYNWLSDFNDTSSNGTTVLNGSVCLSLKEDIWQGIRFYQSLQHANGKGVQSFVSDETVFLPKLYNLGYHGQLDMLRTPEAHGVFLNQIFSSARNDIIIFSPFIRLKKLMETFTDEILRKLEIKRVKTVLVTLPSPCSKIPKEQAKIFARLDQLQRLYPCFSFKTQRDFHAKTLVCDDMICDGSFNWLSAVGDIGHDANNYEVSVAIKGECALGLLNSMRMSAIGQAVMPYNGAPDNIHGLITPETVHATTVNSNNYQDLPVPRDFNKHIRIFSGERFNKQGFCIKLDNNYIVDGSNKTLYFETEEDAKQAAYQVWLESQQITPDDTPERNKKRERRDSSLESDSPVKYTKPALAGDKFIPKNFDAHIKVYSGASFNREGFCVKLDGKYIMDESNSIIYFRSKQLAKQSAYDIWISNGQKRAY